MGKTRGARFSDETSAWLDSYAAERGVDPSALIRSAVEEFRALCEGGVPDLKVPESVLRGVGVCTARDGDLGHVFVSPRVDPDRACKFCGLKGRLTRPVGQTVKEVPNHLDQATSERAEFFSKLRVPMVSGSGDPKKAWPQGMPEEMAKKAAQIRGEARRDG